MWHVVGDNQLSWEEKANLVAQFDKVLGLDLLSSEKIDIPKAIIDLAEDREVARKEKNWGKSDELRQEIVKLGYEVLDRLDGYEIKSK